MKRDALPAVPQGPTAWTLSPASAVDRASWQERKAAAALEAASASDVDILFLPSGAATPYEMQRKAEAWALGNVDAGLRIDLTFRGDRVVWTPQRVLVIGAPDRFDEVACAIGRFTWLENELRGLERASREALDSAARDVRLTHAVTAKDLGESRRVGAQTQSAHGNRIRFTQLEAGLVQPGETLNGAARRLLSEMTLQAEFADRLRVLDDQIEVAQDVYDTVNDRLTEFSHFVREYRVEVLIVVMLALEAGLIIWDMFGRAGGG